ncbi:hypothetical protein [Oleomonas cavernae]|uniref:hypothetical protein n=1 Tax=Oleomonas cavernae TaxID=2320859 RepID=UPI0018F6336E|nr:hypothetical protein [Oleomonas cavernae]
MIPEKLRGRYAMPGWTANGVEPWGLQPDPIGCDGNLFYRGWLNLLLGMRRYVSGEHREQTSFEVSGYQNRRFSWTHERMANFLSAQFAARPQGPHCENTKIWPFCISAAGLGLKLYDGLLGTALNDPFLGWIEFAKKHYMGRNRHGAIDWFAMYYDPIAKATLTLPGPLNAYSGICVLHYLYPQDPQLCIELYEMAMRQLGWSNPKVPLVQLADDPQMLSTALWMARELGDDITEGRIREVTETQFEPRFFGDENSRFAFWLGLEMQWPRGQINATMMMTECSEPGAWSRVFTRPNVAMHSEPSVRNVDYPNLGLRLARNHMDRRELEIVTTAVTPSKKGTPTEFTVDRLPSGKVKVIIDGHETPHWREVGTDAIAISIDIDTHHIRVAF